MVFWPYKILNNYLNPILFHNFLEINLHFYKILKLIEVFHHCHQVFQIVIFILYNFFLFKFILYHLMENMKKFFLNCIY